MRGTVIWCEGNDVFSVAEVEIVGNDLVVVDEKTAIDEKLYEMIEEVTKAFDEGRLKEKELKFWNEFFQFQLRVEELFKD